VYIEDDDKKGHQLFRKKESAPPRENPGYAYGTTNAITTIKNNYHNLFYYY